jgi:hypothetical protein
VKLDTTSLSVSLITSWIKCSVPLRYGSLHSEVYVKVMFNLVQCIKWFRNNDLMVSQNLDPYLSFFSSLLHKIQFL